MKVLLCALAVCAAAIITTPPSYAAGPDIMIDGRPSSVSTTSSFNLFAWIAAIFDDGGSVIDPVGSR
jgi:uncharacterized protein involved in exopolysaccharide biosynthesis